MEVARAIAVLGEYAADQWGLVTTAQAVNAGVNTTTLTRLVSAGSLFPVMRGVYQLAGSQHVRFVTEAAMWLRLDPAKPAWQRQPLDRNGGIISHRSAASILHIGDLRAPQVEISTPRPRRTRDRSVRFYIVKLQQADVTTVDGLPVTSVERTIADLVSQHIDGGHAGDLISDANQQGQLDVDNLAHRLIPYARQYGVKHGDGFALVHTFLRQAGATSMRGEIRPNESTVEPLSSGEIRQALHEWEKLSIQLKQAEAVVAKLRALEGLQSHQMEGLL